MIGGEWTSVVRRAVGIVSIAVLATLVFEAGANLLYWLETGKLYLAAHVAPPRAELANISTKLHPYFGFMNVLSPAYQKAAQLTPNNYDFPQPARYVEGLTGCCDFPIRASENRDKFIVAIFGNSIANGIGDRFQNDRFVNPNLDIDRRLGQIPAAAGKKVVVLNLALGGHKQPQELFTLAYLLAGGTKFDLVLYLAAVNEPIASLANTQSGLAADFPTGSLWLSMSVSLDQAAAAHPGTLLGLLALQYAQSMQHQIEACETASCVMVNRPLLKLARSLSDVLVINSGNPYELAHFVSFPAADHPTGPDRYDEVVRQWQNASRMMAALTRLSGGAFVEIILPTPWVHPSHRLPWPVEPPVTALYGPDAPLALAKMTAAAAALRAEGISAFDATRTLDVLPIDDPQLYADYSGHMGAHAIKPIVDFTIDHLLVAHDP